MQHTHDPAGRSEVTGAASDISGASDAGTGVPRGNGAAAAVVPGRACMQDVGALAAMHKGARYGHEQWYCR
jgi:hypothetical protein